MLFVDDQPRSIAIMRWAIASIIIIIVVYPQFLPILLAILIVIMVWGVVSVAVALGIGALIRHNQRPPTKG